MLSLKLDDFKEVPLRDAAIQLGIPNAATMLKDELLAALKGKLAPESSLIFVPMSPASPKPSYGWWAPLIISILSALFTLGTMIAHWSNFYASSHRYFAEAEKKDDLEWSESEVYSIIENASRNDARGVDINGILRQYATSAKAADSQNLQKKSLTERELRKILLELLAIKVIWQLPEDRYVTVRTTLVQGGEISYEVIRGMGIVLSELVREPGRYTVDQLEKVISEKAKISNGSYHIIINTLINDGGIVRNKDGTLYSASSPPPSKDQK